MRKLINFVIVIVLISFSNMGISQSDNGKFIQFKLYKSFHFDFGLTQGTNTISLGGFSPAIAWGKGEDFNEIQITQLNFFSRGEADSYGAGAEYSYNKKIGGNDRKIAFFIGGGVGFDFTTSFSSQVVNNQTVISTTGKTISAYLFAIPRLTYELRSNILLDFSLSYRPIDFLNSESKGVQGTILTNETTFLPRKLETKVGGIIKF